jgi:hypothetical protein
MNSTAPGRRKKLGAGKPSFPQPWVFILDADEMLPAEAEAEFRTAIADRRNDGYWINRRFMFMGRWLRHAYYPNWNLRLFRHSLGRYEKLTDVATASGDNEVHEHVVVQGPTGRLRCEIDHYAFPSVEVFVEKHNRYSNWEARRGSRTTRSVVVERARRAGAGSRFRTAPLSTAAALSTSTSGSGFRRARRLLFRASARLL